MTKRVDTQHLIIMTPTRTIFDGEVYSVTAENHVGAFDILPGHVNFFTILTAGEVAVDDGQKSLTFMVKKAILKVDNGRTTIYANGGAA